MSKQKEPILYSDVYLPKVPWWKAVQPVQMEHTAACIPPHSASLSVSSARFHFRRPLQRCSLSVHHMLLFLNSRSFHSHQPCYHLIRPHLRLLSTPSVFYNLDPEPCIVIPETCDLLVWNLCMIFSDFWFPSCLSGFVSQWGPPFWCLTLALASSAFQMCIANLSIFCFPLMHEKVFYVTVRRHFEWSSFRGLRTPRGCRKG